MTAALPLGRQSSRKHEKKVLMFTSSTVARNESIISLYSIVSAFNLGQNGERQIGFAQRLCKACVKRRNIGPCKIAHQSLPGNRLRAVVD